MSFRETILNEALVIFERRGIENISTEKLLEVLDISRGTLHGIANSKASLVQLCISHSLTVRQARVEQVMQTVDHPMDAFLQLLQVSIEEASSFSPAFVHDLQTFYPRSWARLQLFMRTLSRTYLEPLLANCIESGYLQQDLPPEFVVRLFLNQIQSLLNQQLFPAAQVDYQDLFKVLIIYYLRGCATPLGQGQIEEFTCKSMVV